MPLCPSCPPGLRPVFFRSDRCRGVGLPSPSLEGGLEEFRARDDMLTAGQRRGELPRNPDLDLLIGQVYGLLWYRILIGHAALTADVAAQLTRALTSA